MCQRPSVLLLLANLLFMTGPASAATLVVDVGGGGHFPAIGPALDAAAAGDTILVLAGTYTGPDNQDLDFAGKDLVVRSDSGPGVTIIDGEGSGRGFYFHTGVSAAAVVEGFTLTRLNVGRPFWIMSGDAPTIRDCVLIHNDLESGGGGGVLVLASSPTFINCVIAENSCPGQGGGVLIEGGAPTFTDCMIIGNRALGRGGGLLIANGAEASILGSTITGNRANLAETEFAGGGLLVTDAATLSLERTIIWGNRAYVGDDLYAFPGTTTNVACSDVDSTGFTGGGSIVYGQDNIYVDPHFCQPAHCREAPWTDGDYSLAANSPCLPENSPCGELIGAGAEGCATVVVWTGAAGTTAWEDPLNWSTLALPGPGDNVQLTLGNVVLASDAQIGWLIQCPENTSEPDTFRIAAGGLLELGIGLAHSRDIRTTTVLNDVATIETNASGITHESEGELDLPGSARFIMRGGYIQGRAELLLDGSFQYLGQGRGNIGTPFVNRGTGEGEPPSGLHIESGTLRLGNVYTSRGLTVIGAGASLQVDTLFVNEPGSTMEIAGNLTGTGQASNWSLWRIDTQDTSVIAPAVANHPDSGQIDLAAGIAQFQGLVANRGTVEVATGAALALAGTFDNEDEGVLYLTGDLTDGGLFTNVGLVQRSGPGASMVTAQLVNGLDPTTGDRGVLRIESGELDANTLDNSGRVVIAGGARLSLADDFSHNSYGLLAGSGTLNIAQAGFMNQGIVSPGFSPGTLHFGGDYTTTPDSRLFIELGGTEPGVGYDQLHVTGTAQLGGALHVDLSGGFVPQSGDTFRIITFASLALRESPFECLSGLQLPGGLYLAPVSLPGAFALVATDTMVANQQPVAMGDTFAVPLNTPTVLTPLANDSDPDEGDQDDLSLVSLHLGSTQGRAYVDPGAGTITYWPPKDFLGWHSFAYVVTDCRGAVDSALVLIEVAEMGLADPDPIPSIPCRLQAPAPNPSHPNTRLSYHVSRAGEVRIAVYDICGRQVQILADGHHPSGVHSVEWRGTDASGRPMASGIYLVRLETAAGTETRKMTLIR